MISNLTQMQVIYDCLTQLKPPQVWEVDNIQQKCYKESVHYLGDEKNSILSLR